MNDDPVVEEIRRNRNEYAKQFNYDLDAICQDLEEKQKRSGRKLVSFLPKKPSAAAAHNQQDAAETLFS